MFILPSNKQCRFEQTFHLDQICNQDIFCFFKFTSYVSKRTKSVFECLNFRMQKWYNFQHYLLLMSAKKNILCAKNKKKINGLKMNLIYYKIMNQF